MNKNTATPIRIINNNVQILKNALSLNRMGGNHNVNEIIDTRIKTDSKISKAISSPSGGSVTNSNHIGPRYMHANAIQITENIYFQIFLNTTKRR